MLILKTEINEGVFGGRKVGGAGKSQEPGGGVWGG